MLRGDAVICGTSTIGTGTLSLAATPAPPGGVDFDVFARATGLGNSAAVFVSYTIIEYTSSAFSTAKQTEKGVGTLTLGGASGIANATLARTTKQSSATSLHSQPATQNIAPGTGISIGTAANTLVFIGASVADVMAFEPYLDSTGGPASIVAGYPLNVASNLGGSGTLISGTDYYVPFLWPTPMLAKRVRVNVQTVYSGGVPVSDAYARLYQVNSSGQPGKLLYDFGELGSAGASFNSLNIAASGAGGNGYFMTPGEYFIDIIVILSGGAAGPKLSNWSTGGIVNAARWGSNFFVPVGYATATGGAGGAAPDPANVTSYTGATSNTFLFAFSFSPS